MILHASYLWYLPSFVEWMFYIILLLGIWLKLKFIYLYMQYEILIYWAYLAHFSFTLPLIRPRFFLFFLFFCFLFSFFKLKYFYQYLFVESLRKQQLRGILLNIYIFNLMNFTKLWNLLKNSSIPRKTFNVVSMLLLGWCDVATSDNVKSTLKQSCVCRRWN